MTPSELREYKHILRSNDPAAIKAFQERMRHLHSLPESFSDYMYDLIKRSGFSKTAVAQRAGLSRDYVFKILNPNSGKRTDERDYILAICIAAKFSYAETQHALELYPFPILDDSDDRSAVIIIALLGGMSIDSLNEMLSNAGHPMLRTSPEMEKAAIGPVRSTVFRHDAVTSKHDEELIASVVRRMLMKKEKIDVWTQPFGCMPCSDGYLAEMKFTDNDGKEKYAQLVIFPEGGSLSVCSQSLHYIFDDDDDQPMSLEERCEDYYDTFQAEDQIPDEEDEDYDEDLDAYKMMLRLASASKYFSYYLKLDAAVDDAINGKGEAITVEEMSAELTGIRKEYQVTAQYEINSNGKSELKTESSMFHDIQEALTFAQEKYTDLVHCKHAICTDVSVTTGDKILWNNEYRY